MTPTPQTRDRLHQLGEDLNALRARRAELKSVRDLARKHEDTNALAAAEIRLAEVEDKIETARTLQSTLLHQAAGVSDFGGQETFLDNPVAIAQLEQLAHSTMPIGNLQLGPAIGRDQLVAMMTSGAWRPSARAANGNGDVTIGDAARRGSYYGTVPQPRRALRLLDLIPTAPMDGGSFDYTPETGNLDTARETAEGAMKPQADVELDDATVIAVTIAHWLKLKRPQLADVPALEQTIRARLVYGVMKRLEDQVVSGDGAGDNLRGILHTTGIGDIEFSDVALSDLALDGIVATQLSDAEPDAVVLNPLDMAAMLKARTDDGTGGRLDSDGAFSLPVPSLLWGLPTVTSKVMPVGQALVGDFAGAATVFVREAVNVRASDSDQDDFTRNRVTLLGEGRFGLAVWQPSAFTLVHFAEA